MKPGVLAVRAINQYRKRDIIAYIGLRYYLENQCTTRDSWVREICPHIVKTRNMPAYYCSYNFKEQKENESIIYRKIFIPGPNEALAETNLLAECAADPVFSAASCVYSYAFPKSKSKEGVFLNYYPGFLRRHDSISTACKKNTNGTVLYTDIRKFYPSISKELALTKWKSTCDSSSLSSESRDLGERLIEDQAKTAVSSNEGSGMIVGPMFSHLIANLVLNDVDKEMVQKMEGNYWRYVDDIVLVGDKEKVTKARSHLKDILEHIGFSLHTEGKDFSVSSVEWLKGKDDFNKSENDLWMKLISNIKRFLICQPQKRSDLESAFSKIGFNIPLLDYSALARESSSLKQMVNWMMNNHWASRILRTLNVNILVNYGLQAKKVYLDRIKAIFMQNLEENGYERKRIITKLRFYASRLLYLMNKNELSWIGAALEKYPELVLHSKIMNAIQTHDVSQLVKYGANAAQAASQIFRSKLESVPCILDSYGEVERQAVAILRLNGINVTVNFSQIPNLDNDPLNQFALGLNPMQIMKSDDLFIREIASLRGIENIGRHLIMLDIAFDQDEQLPFDILDMLHASS